jgi:hypothetical protein
MSWLRDLNASPQVRHFVRHCGSFVFPAGGRWLVDWLDSDSGPADSGWNLGRNSGDVGSI